MYLSTCTIVLTRQATTFIFFKEENMIKKFLLNIRTAVISACTVCACAINAVAATIDDVAATARRLGFPESVIQQGYNQYYEDPELYTSDVLDDAISYLYTYEKDLKAQLGIVDAPSEPETSQPEVNEPTTSETNKPGQEKPSEPQSTTSGSAAISPEIPNKPSDDEFTNMTLDEKRDYIASLTPQQQQQFFNSLSADALKSIVKQLPTDDKAGVANSFVKAGEAMGIKVTVDKISDDGISMSMRNNNGELIDVASVGVIVENTGYDYRGIFALSASLILAAAGALWMVIRKCFRRETK